MSEGRKPVFVAGMGVVASIGTNTGEVIHSFKNHLSGITSIAHLDTRHSHEFPCGEVRLSNSELASLLKANASYSRTILLSLHAAKEALQDFEIQQLNKFRLGFLSASTVGGMDKTEGFYQDFIADPLSGDIRKTMHHDCGKPTDVVAQELGVKGYVTTVSTACSSSANTIMLGSRLIRSGKLDIVLAGGVDALTKFTLNGFNSLMIVDRKQCRPLDQSRTGLNLGEGAGYLLLMSEAAAKTLQAKRIANVSGYGNANDSFHQTALSDNGDGPFFAMNKALQSSGLRPGQIDYINMHGTGTQNNDMAEGRAIERIYHTTIPKLSSTKSFTGHTLGASGSIEAVLSCLAIQNGYVYPNFSFENPIEGLSIKPETMFQEGCQINHVLSNSFGFGGNCTSLVFSKS